MYRLTAPEGGTQFLTPQHGHDRSTDCYRSDLVASIGGTVHGGKNNRAASGF